MTKGEFLRELGALLEKNHVSDAPEIISEYEQHFAFKLADGYTEEEIAAKLGKPEQIAAQYEANGEAAAPRGNLLLVQMGLGLVDLFAGLFFVLISACGAVIAAASLGFAVLGICLIAGVNPYAIIPPIPYWCGAAMGFAALALSILAAVGCVYYCSLVRQAGRSFARFQRNILSAAAGKPVIPPLLIRVQLSPKANRRLRGMALVSLMAFAVCFTLGFAACALSAGTFSFWHAWGWFGYAGA